MPHWLPARWRHMSTGYIVVVVSQVLATILTRLLLGAFAAYRFPEALAFLLVALTAISFGAAPALFATLLGAALSEFVVLPVAIGEAQLVADDAAEVMVFLAVGLCLSMVASATERSRQQAVKERSEAQARELAIACQAQERMHEFLVVASHDLRTPVTAALGYTQLAAQKCDRLAVEVQAQQPELAPLVEAVCTCMGEASETVDRLSRLVTVLFDLSQVRTGQLKLHRTVCDLAPLVRDQVDAVRMTVPQRAIRLQATNAGPVRVLADGDRIGEVVTNFLTNALKYSPTDQAVDIKVGSTGGWAHVAVEDRGPGLPSSELERIWEPFHRVAGIRAQGTIGDGLGVGLHICKTLVELHGGRAGAKSAEGHGSTFWFALPLA